MAEQKSMRKQLSFWLPPWKNSTTTTRQNRQTQLSLSPVETSGSEQPQLHPKSPPEDQQQPPLEEVAASDPQPATTQTTQSPTESKPPPSRKDSSAPSTPGATQQDPRPQTRSQRPSPSRGATQPSPVCSPARQSQPAAQGTGQGRPSPSRQASRGASQSRPTSTAQEALSSPSSGDTSRTLSSPPAPQVEISTQTPPLESEPLPSKALQPNDQLPQPSLKQRRLSQYSQPEKEVTGKNEIPDKPATHPTEVGNKASQKLDSEATSLDSLLKKASPLEPADSLSGSTQQPMLQRKASPTKKKSIRRQEDNMSSSDTPNLETTPYKAEEVEVIPKMATPNKNNDSARPENSGTKQEETERVKPETKPEQLHEQKIQTTEPLTKESDPVPSRLHPDPTKSMKLVRISETKEPDRSPEPNENQKVAVQNVSKRKEGETNARASKEHMTSLQKEVKKDVSRLVQTLGIANPPRHKDGERPICIITLAGENRGASMVVGHATSSSEGSVPIHKAVHDFNHEGRKRHAEKSSSHDKSEAPEINTNINSNTQSINNSILQTSSCSERSPGVHFILNEGPCERIAGDSPQAFKHNSNTISTQKLIHEPSVRRRCLRGLLAESSESDTGGPKRPQRHGCRFRCE